MKRLDKPPFVIYRGVFCKQCGARRECTRGPARRITRDGRECLIEEMREKLRSEEGREIYKKRAYTVEPVMGNLKWNGRKPMMSLRGLQKVRGEFCLMCIAHNVKKIVKRVGGSLHRLTHYAASPESMTEEATLLEAQI